MPYFRALRPTSTAGRYYDRGDVASFAASPGGDWESTPDVADQTGVTWSKDRDGTIYLPGDGAWEDYEFNVQSLKINPATSKPDYSESECELLFDKDDTETVTATGHLPHSFKAGSVLFPHVHWIQAAAGVVKWQLEYKLWDSVGGAHPALFTTITTVIPAFTYVSGTVGQVSVLPAILTSSLNLGLSPCLKIRLSRLGGDAADTYDADARTVKFDIHYLRDSLGSGQERAK